MDLERQLTNLEPERVAIMQVEGPSITGLRNTTNLIASLGSLMVEHLSPNSTWIWAFVSGGKTIFERMISNNRKNSCATTSHFIIPLSIVSPLYPNAQPLENKRWKFCDKYGGFGNLCNENNPENFDYSHLKPFENLLLKSIPVIITAGGENTLPVSKS